MQTYPKARESWINPCKSSTRVATGWVCSRNTGVSRTEVRAKRLVGGRFYQGEDGKTWDRKDMLSIDLMAMLSGPPMFMGMGVVMATGWAMFMGAEAGMLTEAMFTGPVMVTGCCRLTGDVILTVLVEMFIWAAMVTGLLVLPRFIAVVMGAAAVTGVEEAEWQTSVLSFRSPEWFHCQSPLLQTLLKLLWPCVFKWLVM